MNNYFAQNLKLLRKQNGLTQASFARLFDLEPHNIKSYENQGSLPPVNKYMEIMDHYNLDPSGFLNLDMAANDIRRGKRDEEGQESDAEQAARYLAPLVTREDRFQYLEALSQEELQRECISVRKLYEDALLELMELRGKLARLFPETT